MIIKVTIATTVLAFMLPAGAGIAAPGSEVREHYAFDNTDGSTAFNVTVVEASTPNTVATWVYYIESASGAKWRIDREAQHVAGIETFVFTNLRTHTSLIFTAHFPFGFSDMADAAMKRKAHPEPRKETRLSIDFGSRSVSFIEIELDVDLRRNEISKEVSAIVNDDAFVRDLKSLSRLLAFPPFLGACRSLDPLFSAGEQACPAPTGYRYARTLPKCDFDERFGIPCTEEQKDAIGSALKAGKTPRRY
jgi:hypothetical protein